jgi:hypothetical protein
MWLLPEVFLYGLLQRTSGLRTGYLQCPLLGSVKVTGDLVFSVPSATVDDLLRAWSD